MPKGLFLGLLAGVNLWSGDTPTFFEEMIIVEPGAFELTTEHPWNAVSLFSPDGETLPPVWYADDSGEWKLWHALEENHGAPASTLDLLFAGDTQKTLRMKVDEPLSVVGHFFNTHRRGENFVAKFEPFDDDTLDDPAGNPRYVRRPRYISRAEWGADESLRVQKPFHRFFKKWFNAESDLVKPKYRPKLVNKTNAQGEKLFWPISKNPYIEKFIIHHTGEYVTEKRPPAEIMRAIYSFHTITRGWGDIGYNYVIDKQGNIYEGRAGGPQAVGGHTAYHNIGSIGVSLMGNFQREEPTKAQMNILTLLLADHANRFQIDPNSSSFFSGQNSYNISGHRDVARSGHGTACPGKNLHKRLPEIRKKVMQLTNDLRKQEKSRLKLGRDFLKKSTEVQKYLKTQVVVKAPPKKRSIELAKLISSKRISRRSKETFEIKVRNNTKTAWKARSAIEVRHKPEGLLTTPLRSTEVIRAGETGIFRGRLYAKTTPNGKYSLELVPTFLKNYTGENIESLVMPFPFQVSGDKRMLSRRSIHDITKQATASMIKTSDSKEMARGASSRFFKNPALPTTDTKLGPPVKIKLAFFDERFADIQSSQSLHIFNEKNERILSLPAHTNARLISQTDGPKQWLDLMSDSKTLFSLQRVQIKTSGILTIKNYNRGLGSRAYNQFREQINAHVSNDGKLVLVNELPIETYLRGLSEEPSSEPLEKKHAIHVLARSYALVYSGKKRKFHTSLYDLEDDPATSQFYLGYEWERYHSDQIELLKQTQGQVIAYGGQPAIGPYYTQSNGRSSDKWSRAYPWTRAQDLPHDVGLEQKGHGVGLSGNTARELAKEGKNYKEILDYFYENIKVQKAY